MPPAPTYRPSGGDTLHDPLRLAALERSGLMGAMPQQAFERLTRLAGELLGVPVSLVSLVDHERQFFPAARGLPEPWATMRETPLSHSFCRHVVESGEPLVVADARVDPVLKSNGAVSDIGVVAYAGMPLTLAGGERLGSFCAIDSRPREWDARELGILRDLAAAAVTEIELRLALAAAETRSRTDALTGLLNHGAFHDALGRETARARRHGGRLGLILFDIDHFKEVNDSFGHQAGDRALCEVAARIAACLRPEDALGRVGGEEIAWLLPETDAAGAVEAAERARRAIGERPFHGLGTLTVSAGVADLAGTGEAEGMYGRADAALYEAKRSGRDRVVAAAGTPAAAPTRPRPAPARRHPHPPDPLRHGPALRRLFHASNEAMWVYSPRDLAILDVNEPALKLYGYTRPEFLALTLEDLRSAPDGRRLLESVAEGPGRRTDRGQWRHRRRDGRDVWVRIEAHEIDGPGEGNRLVVAHDMTGHRAAERDARRRRDEQSALAEIAAAVARGATPEEVFALAAGRATSLAGASGGLVVRREGDRMCVVGRGGPGPSGWHPLSGEGAVSRAILFARPERQYLRAGRDPFSEELAAAGWQGAYAVPIEVEGRPWGALCALTRDAVVLDAREHLSGVASLIALAVSAARQSDMLVREAREQEVLGDVARMAASGVGLERVFASVAEHVTTSFGAAAGGVCRFDPDVSVVVGAHGSSGARAGTPVPLTSDGALAQVRRTGRRARVDYRRLPATDPVAPVVAARGFAAGVAVPVRVGEALWGAVIVASTGPPLPPDCEERLERFAALVALAVTVAEEHEALVRHGHEQAALRRVATLVAGTTDPSAVVSLVAEEAARLVDADAATVVRLVAGAPSALVAAWPPPADGRGDGDVRRHGGVPAASVPVRVADVVWGSLAVYTDDMRPLGCGARERLVQMAELVGMALANAEARKRLTDLVSRDMLTGLPHHRALHERLGHEVADATSAGRPLSLAIADIDLFKTGNDRWGHQAGDLVLAEVAQRLSQLLLPGEVAARLGGDRFAWVLPGLTAAEAQSRAEALRAAVAARPFPVVGALTLSAGVCDLAHARDADELVRLADGALYWAKRHGRNRVACYTPDRVEVLSAEERAERLERQQALAAVRLLARAVDAKDPATRLHSERVADLAVRLAHEMGWSTERAALLHEAALVHDVGKIGVPDAILFKPGRLDPDEYAEVKRHSALGAHIVEEVLTPEQTAWVRGHHERADGRGYPDGIAGDDVPDGARILALADSWDVMTRARPYSTPMSFAEAVDECRREAGRQFSGDAVAALERLAAAGTLEPAVAEAASPAVAPA